MNCTLDPAFSLSDACEKIKTHMANINLGTYEKYFIEIEIPKKDYKYVLLNYRGPRFYYESRDQKIHTLGLGISHMINKNQINLSCQILNPGQFYFGGQRFDSIAPISPEWQSFNEEFYILPLMQITQTNSSSKLIINFKKSSNLSFWLDNFYSLINILHVNASLISSNLELQVNQEKLAPDKDNYEKIVKKILCLLENSPNQKVVLGRRNQLTFSQDIDPGILFIRSCLKNSEAHNFFFDPGRGAAFFGSSPELLFTKIGQNIFTESLAGTRPRAQKNQEDVKIREELSLSIKDQIEHAHVGDFIERRLQKLNIDNLQVLPLEICELSHVYHLMRRYRARLLEQITTKEILNSLHPTPAVCGLEQSWAQKIIREHENFDRGFYAGPVGIVGRDLSEFCVAIRSALYFEKSLYVYAAGGIVSGSLVEQEWQELNYKQKSMIYLVKN